jgi:hypothetical protein
MPALKARFTFGTQVRASSPTETRFQRLVYTTIGFGSIKVSRDRRRNRGSLDITLNQQSEDPEIRVMSWENARDKRNSSRAFRVNPVYLS